MLTLQDYLHIADLDVDDAYDEQIATFRRSDYLFEVLKEVIHDDKFVSMSAEAQLLYMYLILDSGTGKDRPKALCRLLFGDRNGYIYKPYDELIANNYITAEDKED